MLVLGLSERPPESKQTPLPTRHTVGRRRARALLRAPRPARRARARSRAARSRCPAPRRAARRSRASSARPARARAPRRRPRARPSPPRARARAGGSALGGSFERSRARFWYSREQRAGAPRPPRAARSSAPRSISSATCGDARLVLLLACDSGRSGSCRARRPRRGPGPAPRACARRTLGASSARRSPAPALRVAHRERGGVAPGVGAGRGLVAEPDQQQAPGGERLGRVDEQRLAALALEVARAHRLRDAPAGDAVDRRDARRQPPVRRVQRGQRQRQNVALRPRSPSASRW